MEHEHRGTYNETFFYIIYRFLFHTEKSAVQVCISPSLFIIGHNNTT
jgi:hypothetical protein